MTDTPTPITAAPTARGCRHPEEMSALRWWRRDSYAPLGADDVAKLRKMLSQIALPGHRGGKAAVAADAAAAVRIALRVGTTRKGVANRRLDCAASAALLCALAGNVAAATALAHLRRRLGIPPLVRSGDE